MFAEILLAMVLGVPCSNTGCEIDAKVATNRLVGRSVLCYYRNVDRVVTKAYVPVRVYIGGRSGLVNVPVINGHLPIIQWQLDSAGVISTMTCNYENGVKYNGEAVTYGEESQQVKAKLSCTPSPDPIQVTKIKPAPVPSKTTSPIPRVGDVPFK